MRIEEQIRAHFETSERLSNAGSLQQARWVAKLSVLQRLRGSRQAGAWQARDMEDVVVRSYVQGLECPFNPAVGTGDLPSRVGLAVPELRGMKVLLAALEKSTRVSP